MTEINSRGDEEEHIITIANYLNTEEHLSDAMKAEPENAKEIASLLDDVRKTRQEVVKQWSKGRANPNHWCGVKHVISCCYHLHEIITNAARDNPEDIPELTRLYKKCSNERDKLVELFLSGSGKGFSDECPRCEADLGLLKEKLESTETSGGEADNVWLLLCASFLVVFLIASAQK